MLNEGGRIFSLGHKIINFLCPPSCFSCGDAISGDGCLCAACFASLHIIVSPFCRHCGEPFSEYEIPQQSGCCAQCTETPPIWRQARAVFVYNDAARNLIFPLKYANRTRYASFLALFMNNMLSYYSDNMTIDPNTVFIPVPLHKKKLRKRGYNQAALLAGHLAKKSGFSSWPDALIRRRNTRPLAHLSVWERQEELHNVFLVRECYHSILVGKNVIVVDDILTTGVTAAACTRALLDVGCAHVDILVAARVCNQSLTT